ncbi:MAG: ATP-binding protein [Actinomycetota bacterium]
MPEALRARPLGPVVQAFFDAGSVPPRLAEVACAMGMVVEPFEDDPACGRSPMLMLGPAEEYRMQSGLTVPFAGFVECEPEDDFDDGWLSTDCLDAVRKGGLCLAMTTMSAYLMDIPALLVPPVAARFGIGSDAAGAIELALAEAVANALLHGNLGIDSALRNDMDQFEKFRATLLANLADPQMGRRRMEITALPSPEGLRITVRDQGEGFDLGAQLAKPAEQEAKSGRGLGLIRKLCRAVEGRDGGRTLVMVF